MFILQSPDLGAVSTNTGLLCKLVCTKDIGFNYNATLELNLKPNNRIDKHNQITRLILSGAHPGRGCIPSNNLPSSPPLI